MRVQRLKVMLLSSQEHGSPNRACDDRPRIVLISKSQYLVTLFSSRLDETSSRDLKHQYLE